MITVVFLALISSAFAPYVDIPVELGTISGFDFCSHLDGSSFDMNSLVDYNAVKAHIAPEKVDAYATLLFGKPQLLSETITEFTKAVDTIAISISRRLQGQLLKLFSPGDHYVEETAYPNHDAAHLFACLSVAEGTHPFAQLVSEQLNQKILRFVKSERYFDGAMSFAPLDLDVARMELAVSADMKEPVVALPNINTDDSDADGKLAFILMVHKDVDNVIEILKDVAAARSTVLVHVDGNNPEMKRDMARRLEWEYEKGNFDPNRVQVMERSFKGVWAHSSLIFMQVEAMFQLLKMNEEWEYVINMSGNDVLLVDHAQIYSQLSPYGDANWILRKSNSVPVRGLFEISHLDGDSESVNYDSGNEEDADEDETAVESDFSAAGRLHPPAFLSEGGDRTGPLYDTMYDRKSSVPFIHNHQWMILHRSTPALMQRSPSAAMFFAYNEFETCPDESFILRLLSFVPMYDEKTRTAHEFRIVNDNKRFLEFSGIHPRLLDINDMSTLTKAVANGAVMARKVNLMQQSKLMRWIRERRADNWGTN